jgi:hypothetical protein
MFKLVVAIVLLTIAGGGARAQISALPQEPQETSTRFGSLRVGEDRTLLFNGRRLNPPVEGNYSLNFGGLFRLGPADVVLVMDSGGTACPYLYYLVSVTKSGAKATPAFGTCAELTGIRRRGDSIEVRMPGFLGPFEPAAERRRAERRRHVFVFRAGVVTENGRPVR